jgi:hypothetical protein
MLTRLHRRFCTVALAPDGTRLGYLLALSVDEPADAVFVWQLAATFRGRRIKAQDQLASNLKKAIQACGRTQILFTAVPNSDGERSIRSLAKRIFSITPRMMQPLPKSVSQEEREYRLQCVLP